MQPADKILIAGGGVGGLALGIALTQAGFPCEVFEREPELRPAGAGLLLQTGPMQALERLGLDAELRQRGQIIGKGMLRLPDGGVLQGSDLTILEKEFGQPTIAIHRARLHAVLASALGAERLRTGKKLIDFEARPDGVTVRFEDGTEERGALLVGADGLRSAVRRKLLGDSPLRYAGYSTYRGIAPLPAGFPVEEVSEFWGRGVRFGMASVGHGEVYWFAVFNAPAGGTDARPERLLAELFGGFVPPVPDLIARTPADRLIRTDIHDRVPVARWSHGRVTLLGDAAHPTTPNLGQGAGMAIEDAVVLARHLTIAPDFEAALGGYEQSRLARTTRIVNASWQVGRIGQFDGAFRAGLRNFLVRNAPASLAMRQLRENARFQLP